ncbi:MAG TPA: oligosaccharide flippase family protein [Terriglobia bacterium]|nr:oligosaccharide flippase family protein [Terriglobia bacterium]
MPASAASLQSGSQSRYVRNFATTVGGQGTVLALGIFTGITSARLLGPQGRGELAAVTLWPLALALLTSLGLSQAIVFHSGKQRFTVLEIWTATLVIWLLQSIAVLGLGWAAIPILLRHHSPEARHLSLIFLAFAPLIMFVGYPASLLQGLLDLLSFNLIRVITPAIYAVGLAVLLLRERASVGEVVVLQILGASVAVAMGAWLVLGRTRGTPGIGLAWNRAACSGLLRFGWKSQLSSVTSYINQRFDQLLLSLFVGPRDLGLYVVAVALASSISFFPQAAGIVTIATGSSLAADEARKVIAQSFRVTLAALSLGCAALLVLCPWLMNVAYGPSYSSAVTACKILLPGTVALGLNQVLYDGARALEQPALPSYAEGLSTVITLGLLFLLLPRLGFVGAAIASTVAYTASLTLMLALARSRMQLSLRDLLGARRSVPVETTPNWEIQGT